jgi:hypothetical protein
MSISHDNIAYSKYFIAQYLWFYIFKQVCTILCHYVTAVVAHSTFYPCRFTRYLMRFK